MQIDDARWREFWGEDVASRLEKIDRWDDYLSSCWPDAMPVETRMELLKARITLEAEYQEKFRGDPAGLHARIESFGAARMLKCFFGASDKEYAMKFVNSGGYTAENMLAVLEKHAVWFE